MRGANIFMLVVLSFFVVSCGKEDVSFPNEENSVQRMLREYYNSFNPQTRGQDYPIVTDFDKQYFKIVGDSIVQYTQLIKSDIDSSLFDVTTVEFNLLQKKGYAILSEDERVGKVLFFSDRGDISDTVDIPPLKQLIENIPKVVFKMICDSTQLENSRSTYTYIVNPLVKYTWGVGFPYNNYMPSCNSGDCASKYNGHIKAGSITTTVAQVIAAVGKYRGTFYRTNNIDFESLPTETLGFINDELSQKIIASYFHEVSLCCQTKYSCGNVEGSIRAVYHYLTDLGYDCFYASYGMDFVKLENNLIAGFPHIMNEGNSAWIVDGIRTTASGTTEIHLNWGADGNSNCWTNYLNYASDDVWYNYSQLYINGVK
jgi:hypothetical protein